MDDEVITKIQTGYDVFFSKTSAEYYCSMWNMIENLKKDNHVDAVSRSVNRYLENQ